MRGIIGTAAILTLATILRPFTPGVAAQANTPSVDGSSPLAGRVQSIIVHNSTILDGLAQLSAQSSELSFSFEEILKPRFNDPEALQVRFSLDIRNRAVREVLDALCERDPRYTWTADGTAVNVFPRAVEHDGSYLMNRNIPQLELRDQKNAGEAAFAVVAELPPPFEQIAYAQAGGDISYAAPWHARLRNVTVRQAFNLIARQLNTRGGWVVSGSLEFRTIGFHNGPILYRSPEPGKEMVGGPGF
jgi:hypothetical protein